MKSNSDNFRQSAIQGIMKRIKAKPSLCPKCCRARRRKTKLIATEEGEANEETPKD